MKTENFDVIGNVHIEINGKEFNVELYDPSNLEDLDKGTKIEVVLRNGEQYCGKFKFMDEDNVVIGQDDCIWSLPIPQCHIKTFFIYPTL